MQRRPTGSSGRRSSSRSRLDGRHRRVRRAAKRTLRGRLASGPARGGCADVGSANCQCAATVNQKTWVVADERESWARLREEWSPTRDEQGVADDYVESVRTNREVRAGMRVMTARRVHARNRRHQDSRITLRGYDPHGVGVRTARRARGGDSGERNPQECDRRFVASVASKLPSDNSELEEDGRRG